MKRNDFTILRNVLDEKHCTITESLSISSAEVSQKKDSVFGVRNLLNISPEMKEFSESETVRNIAEKFLGEKAKVVRAIYFDKMPDANWKVPWHQDLTISVKEKRETEGFSAWTVKAEIQHVQPPVEILEKMIALRFHLDNADETNGALKIIPKSQGKGRLSAVEIKKMREANESVCLPRQTRRLFNNAPVNFAFVVRRNKSKKSACDPSGVFGS